MNEREEIRHLSLLASYYAKDTTRTFRVVFGGERSWWAPTGRLCIQSTSYGRPLTLMEKRAKLIHECGHVRFTQDWRGKTLPIPFGLFNLLEDQRVDTRQRATFADAATLYENLRTIQETEDYPQGDQTDEDFVAEVATKLSPGGSLHGQNFGLLLARGGVLGLDTPARRHLDKIIHKLSETFPDVKAFAVDFLAALVNTWTAETSWDVCHDIGATLYGKWAKYFPTETEEDFIVVPGPQGGTGDPDAPNTNRTPPGAPDQDSTGLSFLWDEARIRQEAGLLKRALEDPPTVQTFYGDSGHRLVPRRLAGASTKVFKARETVPGPNGAFPPIFVVMDLSGSMNGEPYENSAHVVRILDESGCFPGMVVVQCSSAGVTRVTGAERDKLNEQNAWGGSEEFEQLLVPEHRKLLKPGMVVVVLTDANTGGDSADALKTLGRQYKLIGLYVGGAGSAENVSEEGRALFPVFLQTESVDKIGILLGRYLRKNVVGRTTVFA